MPLFAGHADGMIEAGFDTFLLAERNGKVLRTDGPPLSRTRGLVARSLMRESLQRLWQDDDGQDIAEYAVMLAVILAIVVGTIRLIGAGANNVFSSVASSIQ